MLCRLVAVGLLAAAMAGGCGSLGERLFGPPDPELPWRGPYGDAGPAEDAGLIPDTDIGDDWMEPLDTGDLAELPDGVHPEDWSEGPTDWLTCDCTQDADCGTTGMEPCFEFQCLLDQAGCGQCVEVPSIICDVGGPCTYFYCDPEEGGCVEVREPDGSPCDDQDHCTKVDECKDGACVGFAVSCEDMNVCTVDICDPATGECAHVGADIPCDDGNPCSVNDHCVAGTCAGGTALDCDDGNPCTANNCNPVAGCIFPPLPGCCLDAAECDDLNACTVDSCQDLLCYHKLTFCNDGDPCTIDSCTPLTGCTFEPVAECCNTDSDCGDNNACTTDFCLGMACHHAAVVCNDGDVCTNDGCEPAVGCVFPAVPGCCHTDAGCNDQNMCTSDWCENNKCAHGPVPCNDGNICTFDNCMPNLGCVFDLDPECCFQSSDCNDGDLCTAESCIGNKCSYSIVACGDDDPCTEDSCHPDEGCLHKVTPPPFCCTADWQCDDGDVCTSDTCIGNKCDHVPIGGPDCCVADCTGKECGLDGCGGSCGQCAADFFCTADFMCEKECFPDCLGKECGSDGCGTYCGWCADNEKCNLLGQCVLCQPFCWGKECGANGCGGSCGLCGSGFSCQSDIGKCIAGCACEGDECWMDSFEHGTLDNWSFEGDAEVDHNMGVAVAPDGWYMAVVGNGISELEVGWIEKTFCPPASADKLKLKWKFYSEEFIEWCGDDFQDSLVILLDNGTQTIVALNVTIDELCPTDSCFDCGSKYVGLEEDDVNFDMGGVWTTPWQDLEFSLPPGFASKPITMSITVTDIGDMIYTSVALIDAIEFL